MRTIVTFNSLKLQLTLAALIMPTMGMAQETGFPTWLDPNRVEWHVEHGCPQTAFTYELSITTSESNVGPDVDIPEADEFDFDRTIYDMHWQIIEVFEFIDLNGRNTSCFSILLGEPSDVQLELLGDEPVETRVFFSGDHVSLGELEDQLATGGWEGTELYAHSQQRLKAGGQLSAFE